MQVYNFGTNKNIDTEDIVFALYDVANAEELKIQVENKDDNVIVVKFI